MIVPAHAETAHLARLLDSIAGDSDLEVIVSIPAGDDLSAKTAAPFGVTVCEGVKGRGAQLHLGAQAAGGANLLFCHADTILPEGWKEAVIKTMARESVSGGAFKFAIDSPLLKYGVIAATANVRAGLLGLVYGDQAVFTSRDIYLKTGGFRPLPVMEDVDFIARLRRIGKVVIVDKPAKTSPRRWEKEGTVYCTLRNAILIFLYLLGVAPEKLARFFR